MQILVRVGVSDVARAAADQVVDAATKAIAARGRFTLVLAGGSTPAALYERLALPQVARAIDWSSTWVFFGDERCVPAEHEWSNYGMARRALLSRVPLPTENVHRMRGEDDPASAASAYADTLGRMLAPQAGRPPQFDLVLLGMGDDGHIASLFPGMPALNERAAWVVGTAVPEYVRPQVARVTLTLTVLNAARNVLFLVTGETKAEAVRRVLREAAPDSIAGPGAGSQLPAAQVRPVEGYLTWLLDEPAAFRLKEG